MEADWEFEVGPDAPVIAVHWEGFLDLAAHPEQVTKLPEVADFPQLAETLVRLNGAGGIARTSKCDVWQVNLDEEPLDTDELDAPTDTARAAWAGYIDLTAHEQRWKNPEEIQQDCAALTARLHSVALHCCRTDLVIRRAILAGGEEELGITVYFIACGLSEEDAKRVLGDAFHAFADSVLAAWAN
jgi:hypothetical protein